MVFDGDVLWRAALDSVGNVLWRAALYSTWTSRGNIRRGHLVVGCALWRFSGHVNAMRADGPIQGTPLCSHVTVRFGSAATAMREARLVGGLLCFR